jgi:hypothetical protein
MSEVAPLAAFSLCIKGAASARRLDEGPLSARAKGDELVLHLPRLDSFAAIEVTQAIDGNDGETG